MKNKFGNLLKNLIEEKNIKSKVVAQKINYDNTYLSKWITGKKLPSSRTIDAVCSKLSDIFSNGENKEQIKSDLIKAYYSDLDFLNLEHSI